jgi:hypothetical protein
MSGERQHTNGNDRKGGSSSFCDDRFCQRFDARKYFQELRQMLAPVPPIDLTPIKRLHEARDHKGIVQCVKRLMNLEDITISVFWVSESVAAGPKDAPAWVELPQSMPFYRTKEFKEMTVKMFFRKSFFQQAYDQAALAVAHELSHVVLESIHHRLRNCEKAVDVAVMILGFGQLYEATCHQEKQVGNQINIKTLGYLTLEEARQVNRLLPQPKMRPIKPPPYKPKFIAPKLPSLRLNPPLIIAGVVALALAIPAYMLADLQVGLRTDVRVGLTNLTLIYRLSIARANVDFPALLADERRRLCGNGFSTYRQEYRDRSDQIMGSLDIASCP